MLRSAHFSPLPRRSFPTPVLACRRLAVQDISSFLSDAFQLPALDRIAWAFLEFGATDAGVRAMNAYDGLF